MTPQETLRKYGFYDNADQVDALVAALREIKAAWDGHEIPTEDVGARMYLIASTALAPFEKGEP